MRRRKPAPPLKSRGNLTHMEHNGTRIQGASSTARDYILAMEAYDQLPHRMRQELRRVPFNVDPIGALEYVRRVGEAEALRVLRDSIGVGLTKVFRETGLRTGVCRD